MTTTPRPPNGSLTDLPGVRCGLWTDHDARTGCAVIVFDTPNVAAAEVRGAAPGTREYALLQPGMTVQSIDALVLTGGSGFGLGAADGVMKAARDAGRGYDTAAGKVPIVPAAVVFDLATGDPSAAPTPQDGAWAYEHATGDPIPSGPLGPGVGCTISKWRGAPQPGGIGNAAVTIDGVTVAALAVVNATGDLFDLDGNSLTGGPPRPGAPAPMAYGENTTLVALVTDAALTRVELGRLIVRAHDAMGACIRPAHTRYDGDICFAVSVGGRTDTDTDTPATPRTVDAAGEAAFVAVGEAISAAVPVSTDDAEEGRRSFDG